MGILDMTDQFCDPLKCNRQENFINGEIKAENKLHEQPIVSFVQKDNEQDVIYREEL